MGVDYLNLTKEQEKLVEDNIKLAYYMANKWYARLTNYNLPIDDITSECLLGLTKAALTFKQDKGVKFATYACKVINNAVLMLIRKEKFRNREISPQMDLSIEELEEKINYNGEKLNAWYSAERAIAKDDMNEWLDCEVITSTIKKMRDRDKKVLMLSFNGYTQKDIAEIEGITQSYVSRILQKAKKRIDKEKDWKDRRYLVN